jgi:hypothetical protein
VSVYGCFDEANAAVAADPTRALLIAALGFLKLRDPPALVALRRWLDSWTGVGAVVTGMERQGYDVSLTRYPEGWRAPSSAATTRRGDGWARC